MSLIRETEKKCVLCKHWNGTVGSTTIKPIMGRSYEYDPKEKKSCYLKRFETMAFSVCPKFENRYK